MNGNEIHNIAARFNTAKIRYKGYKARIEGIYEDVRYAKAEFNEKYPGFKNFFNRRSMATERNNAEDYIVNRRGWNDVEFVAQMMVFDRQLSRGNTMPNKLLLEIEDELETRHRAIKKSLDIISGKTSIKQSVLVA